MEFLIALLAIYVLYRVLIWLLSSKKRPPASGTAVRFEVSGPLGDYSGSERSERSGGKPAKWYGVGQSISVRGYDINGGMVYSGETLLAPRGYDNDACLIHPKLSVSPAEPWEAG